MPSLARSSSKRSTDSPVSPLPDAEQQHDPSIQSVRPPIDCSNFVTFVKSISARFRSIWTPRFTLSILAGQLVSLCITCTSVVTTELVMRGWSLPTTQTFFLYFSLLSIYTPYTMYQYGFKGWANVVLRDGWKYFILAACDVEGNFLVVKAYDYTTLLSCMLLDTWAIPVCMFFVWVYMRPKYYWTQLLGIFICIAGMGLLVASDQISNGNNAQVKDMVRGDIFMIVGATLYGFTNATEEFFVRRRPLYEVVGQLGMWGTIINGIQAASLEHKAMTEAPWNGPIIGLLFAYTSAMLILYTVAPILYRLSSSVYYNLSLLSSDFYGLLFGLFLFNLSPYFLYFIAFTVVLSGLVTYFWSATPEEQGKLDPRPPTYVNSRNDRRAQKAQAQDQAVNVADGVTVPTLQAGSDAVGAGEIAGAGGEKM